MGVRLAIGEEFAGHRIERLIGRGGMGVVYVAEHLRLGRKVAIKVLDPDLAGDETARQRFIRESRLAAALEHRNIVQVYDAGEVDDVAYISMQLVDGMDLAALLRAERALQAHRTLAIGAQVAAALDTAYAKGLVHRDVKPANILLAPPDAQGEERAFLTDFGITKLIASERTTEAGQFIGTIDYMAPEQIRGDILDGRADEYSLACVLFQCLTGVVPFKRDERVSVLYAQLLESPPQLADLGVESNQGLEEAIRRGMAKRADHRFQTCSQLVEAAAASLSVVSLEVVAADSHGGGGGTADAPRPTTRPMTDAEVIRRGRHRSRRSRRRGLLVGLVAMLLVGSTVGIILGVHPKTHPGQSFGTTGVASSATGNQTAPPQHVTPPPPTGPGIDLASITWNRVADPSNVFGGQGDQGVSRAVAAPSTVVAVGYDAPVKTDTNAAVWVSHDGTSWTRAAISAGTGPGFQNMAAVTYQNDRFIAVGSVISPSGDQDGAVWNSKYGSQWVRVPENGTLGGAGNQQIRRIIPYGKGLVAVGFDDSHQHGRDACVWTSRAGATWNRFLPAPFGGPGNQESWNVAQFHDQLVMIGTDNSGGDHDGAVWTGHGTSWQREDRSGLRSPGQQFMKVVVPDGNHLIAMGSDRGPGTEGTDAAAWTSTNGKTWTQVPVQAFRAPGDQEIDGAIGVGNGVVAVGEGGVWTSLDGITWKHSYDPATNPGEVDVLKGVVMLGGKLVAVGHSRVNDEGSAAAWIGTSEVGGSPLPEATSRTSPSPSTARSGP